MSSEYVKHQSSFAGYPVVDWKKDQDPFKDGTDIAVAIRATWDYGDVTKDDGTKRQFMELIAHPDVGQLPALVIGMWSYDETIKYMVDLLIEHQAKFTRLKALFLGDITYDENEISWIKQDNLAPLWRAYPDLEYLTIRGASGLEIGDLNLPKLKSLRIESGGLPREVVQAVGNANLPELESLVLWLGTADYGSTVTRADLAAFYECANKPKLKYLGLCNSDIADEVAEFMATAPVLARLDTLELSMGELTDEGALALITSPYIRSLKKLDLHYHYCSDGMIKKLEALASEGLEVDASDVQDGREWRFVAVGE